MVSKKTWKDNILYSKPAKRLKWFKNMESLREYMIDHPEIWDEFNDEQQQIYSEWQQKNEYYEFIPSRQKSDESVINKIQRENDFENDINHKMYLEFSKLYGVIASEGGVVHKYVITKSVVWECVDPSLFVSCASRTFTNEGDFLAGCDASAAYTGTAVAGVMDYMTNLWEVYELELRLGYTIANFIAAKGELSAIKEIFKAVHLEYWIKKFELRQENFAQVSIPDSDLSNLQAETPLKTFSPTEEWFPGDFPQVEGHHMVFWDEFSYHVPNGGIINEKFSRALMKDQVLAVMYELDLQDVPSNLFLYPKRNIVAYGKWQQFNRVNWASVHKNIKGIRNRSAGWTLGVPTTTSNILDVKSKKVALQVAQKLEKAGYIAPDILRVGGMGK